MPLHRTALASARAAAAALALSACAADATEPSSSVESAAVPDADASTARVDADADGRAVVRATGFTLRCARASALEEERADVALTVACEASRAVEAVEPFVPDDRFGEATTLGPRRFEVRLRGGHEVNTVLSGAPLYLAVTTRSGAPRRFEAEIRLEARVAGADARAPLRLAPRIEPVFAGPPAEPLRYRIRATASRSLDAVTAAMGADGAVTIQRPTPRRFDIDLAYDALALAARPTGRLALRVDDGARVESLEVRAVVALQSLGLTTGRAEDAWPEPCLDRARRCVAARASRGERDLSACGPYRTVTRCAGEAPAPDADARRVEARVRDDVLARTGVRFDPVVLSTRAEGATTFAVVGIGLGGALEVALTADGAVSLVRFVRRPALVEANLVARLERALRVDLGLGGATAVAVGAPRGAARRFQVAVEGSGPLRAMEVELRRDGRAEVAPFTFDEGAFREMAPALAARRALTLAAQVGLYAELEVYLRTMPYVAAPEALTAVTPAASPVGFDAGREAQLVAPRVWGDQAAVVTLDRRTGALRVDVVN